MGTVLIYCLAALGFIVCLDRALRTVANGLDWIAATLDKRTRKRSGGG